MATPPASDKRKSLFSVVSGGVKLRRAPWCALGFRPPRRPPSGWFYVPAPADVAAASGSIGTAARIACWDNQVPGRGMCVRLGFRRPIHLG